MKIRTKWYLKFYYFLFLLLHAPATQVEPDDFDLSSDLIQNSSTQVFKQRCILFGLENTQVPNFTVRNDEYSSNRLFSSRFIRWLCLKYKDSPIFWMLLCNISFALQNFHEKLIENRKKEDRMFLGKKHEG